jgi:hypothetical protein
VPDGDRVRFVHPLLRSAVYDRASPAARRRRRREVAERVADPVERALHLALGTVRPDANLAVSLEADAEPAAGRGGRDMAAMLLEHAARLTPADDRRRVWRLLRAAHYAQAQGDLQRAAALLACVDGDLHDGAERGCALLLRASR